MSNGKVLSGHKKKVKKRVAKNSWQCVFALLALLLYLFPVKLVQGDSMLPTFNDGDLIIVSRIAAYEYGDVIIGMQPTLDGNSQAVIKRVMGKAGDNICVETDGVYRNGEFVSEDYTLDKTNSVCMSVIVPEGSVFVLGDNRNHSYDSRQSGCMTKRMVTGVVVFNLTKFIAVH